MPVQFQGFDALTKLEVVINGPDPANRLLIITGAALLAFTGNNALNFVRDVVVFPVASFSPTAVNSTRFVAGSATASLASITKEPEGGPGTIVEVIPAIGWAVDAVQIRHDASQGDVLLTANVAVRGFASTLLRIAFQANLLIEEPKSNPAAV
jgi:hypothetical protein